MYYVLMDQIEKLEEELRFEKSVNKRLERQLEYLMTQLEIYQANKVTKFDPYV